MLKDEEEHASDLVDLLYIVDPSSGKTEGQDPGTNPLSKASQASGNGKQKQPSGRESSSRRGALPGEPRSETSARHSAQSTEQFSGRGSVGAGSSKIIDGNSAQAHVPTNRAEPHDVEADASTRARRAARVNKPHRKAG
jgi:hypothetical protein